mgnify:CR=1 FL=1
MGLPHVDRLRERVQALVGPSEGVRGAFVVHSRSAPGTEAVAGVFAGLLGGLTVLGLRRSYSIALTDHHLLVIRNRGESKPQSIEQRLDGSTGLGPIDGYGDHRIAINGTDYWVPLRWLDEARRTQRLSTS